MTRQEINTYEDKVHDRYRDNILVDIKVKDAIERTQKRIIELGNDDRYYTLIHDLRWCLDALVSAQAIVKEHLASEEQIFCKALQDIYHKKMQLALQQ